MSRPPVAVVADWIAAVNAHEPEALELTLAPDFVWELGASHTQGASESREAWRAWFLAFPDFEFEILQTLEAGAFVVSRLRMRGTHRGDFRFRGTHSMEQALPASGRRSTSPAVRCTRCGTHGSCTCGPTGTRPRSCVSLVCCPAPDRERSPRRRPAGLRREEIPMPPALPKSRDRLKT